jgi:hypothetical protein
MMNANGYIKGGDIGHIVHLTKLAEVKNDD